VILMPEGLEIEFWWSIGYAKGISREFI
jgi:hypothetical protein